MSMSTYVIGVVPPDDDWKKMKAAYDACIEADIEVPESVMNFFGGDEPDDAGVIINLSSKQYVAVCREWRDESGEGYELDVADIPKNVKTLRFYNSW